MIVFYLGNSFLILNFNFGAFVWAATQIRTEDWVKRPIPIWLSQSSNIDLANGSNGYYFGIFLEIGHFAKHEKINLGIGWHNGRQLQYATRLLFALLVFRSWSRWCLSHLPDATIGPKGKNTPMPDIRMLSLSTLKVSSFEWIEEFWPWYLQ